MRDRRWLARGAFALVLAAVVVVVLLLAVAGWRSLAMIGLTAIGVCLVLAGGYWFLAHRGVVRWLAFILVLAAPVLILVTFALHSLLWVAIVAVLLMLLAAGTGRTALRTRGWHSGRQAVELIRRGHGHGLAVATPTRWWSRPTCRRSRSVSTG